MEYIKDLVWTPKKSIKDLVDEFKSNGFQSIELNKAARIVLTMARENAKIFFAFTSNMVSSGLRGLFAQWIKYGLADVVITTAGAIEEDIMKSLGEKFLISSFSADDVKLHEQGRNRIGNIVITNDSYIRFEGFIVKVLEELARKKPRVTVSEMLNFIGSKLDDENSILYQAYKHNVPVFCPGITDGSIGFHLYLVQQKHREFVVDVVRDFANLILFVNQDDKKGVLALGGGISKHHAILGTLISGGADYAVYITTSREYSGSMSGATTKEAKSWGKVKDDSDSVTVHGDVSILFPLLAHYVLDTLYEEGRFRVE